MNSVVKLFFVVKTILLRLCLITHVEISSQLPLKFNRSIVISQQKLYIFLLKSVMLKYFNSIFCILRN